MRFPNAFGGVKKIWIAEILSLIGAAFGLIAAFMAIGTVGMAAAAGEAGTDAAVGAALGGALMGGMGMAALTLVAGIIGIVAIIIELVGLNQAGKDEINFKRGFYAALIGLVVSVVAAALRSNNVLYTIFSIANTVIQIFILYSVVQGVRTLAEQMGNQEMVARSDTLFKLGVVFYGVSLLASIIGLFAVTLSAILSIVAAVASIVLYILYLSYLGKAKNMLAA